MSQIRINVTSLVNNAAIRREKRNGRDVIVVPSATLPDNVIMNRMLYPAEEIEKSFMTLNRTPAPLGHPVVNGLYVSARDPDAINGFWCGAYNENVRREGGRVLMDKVIDVEVAQSLERGRELLAAIDAGDPIHTSTGLNAQRIRVNCESHDFEVRNMHFDHDAILTKEKGAATPMQGVGMLVNGQQVDVVNVSLPDSENDWIADMVVSEVERQERQNKWADLKNRVREAITSALAGVVVNSDEDETVDQKQFDELKAQVESLTAANSAEKIKEGIDSALAPIAEQLKAVTEANAQREQAEKDKLIERVVNVGLLDEETAKTLTINALTTLAEKCKPGAAAPIAGHFTANAGEDEFQDYDMNAAIDGGK